MTVTGYTFDKAMVPANRDSILFDKFNFGRSSVIKGRYNSMELTSNGLNVTVDTGYAIVQGRLIEISSPEIVAIPANTTGYIAITLDLSQENETTGTPGQPDYTFKLNQGKVGFVKSLVSEDTNAGRPIFTLQLAQITTNGTDVTITKNWNVYNNYVLAPDGVIFGDDVSNYDSALIGNKWYSGGQSPKDIIIAPSTGKKLLLKNDSGGNGDMQVGKVSADNLVSLSKKKTLINFMGATIRFTEMAGGVEAYLSGSMSVKADFNWVNFPSKIPNSITPPSSPIVLDIVAFAGIGGVSVKSAFSVKIAFKEDRSIVYRVGSLRDNEWTVYTLSGLPVDGSVSWFK